MSGQNEDAAYQKERADKAEAELENFKREARQLQEFLQAQSTKKQAQIRKLKEQSIMKQKAFKGQKVQISQLQSQITSLKQQLKQKSSIQIADNSADLLKKQQQITHLKEQLQKLNIKNQQLIIKIQSLSLQLQQKVKQKEDLQNNKHKRQLQLQSKLELITNQLQVKKQLLQSNSKKLNKAESKESGLKHSENRANDLQRKGSKKQLNINRQIFEKQRQKYEQKIRRFEQALQRSQKSLKDYKYKLQSALQQNQQLQYQLSIGENHNNGAQLYTLNSTSPINIKSIDDDHDHSAKINISCLLLTKQHYISPFLQIYEEKNLIKIYKSSRSGCFQKSMGYYRHKFNMLTYEQQALVESIVNKVLKGGQENNHSIIIYGVKKSNKKYLMSKIIVGLKEFLLEKLQNSVDVVSALFMKRSSQNEKNYLQEGNNKNSILQVLNKVIALGYKNQEKSKDKGLISPRKTQSKPKVRYFNIRLDQFYLQIGTSSYTNLSFRDKMTTSQMLNNIIFSKLPNQLQSSVAEKYLILTLNPIVDLYDECRNTLSTTICKGDHVKEEEDERNWKGSPIRQPIREQLNDMAKKKFQTIQRQNQQTSLRIRKLQQDCFYYKTRFDELQFRLKNLLNTHSGQNSYLKKSPITLSYQKLLKFVHSVQSRNNLSANLTQINSSYMLKSHIQAQKHNESIDAL